MISHNNIDLVQINLAPGQHEYYLPQNVHWAARRVDRLRLYLAPCPGMASPVDGITPVVQAGEADNLYLDLYGADQACVARRLAARHLLHTANHPPRVAATLSLPLSRLYFTGGGVPPEIQSRIFEKGVSSKGEDRGLGLCLIHQLVEEHHGTIDLMTEAGAGTCFTLTFTDPASEEA